MATPNLITREALEVTSQCSLYTLIVGILRNESFRKRADHTKYLLLLEFVYPFLQTSPSRHVAKYLDGSTRIPDIPHTVRQQHHRGPTPPELRLHQKAIRELRAELARCGKLCAIALHEAYTSTIASRAGPSLEHPPTTEPPQVDLTQGTSVSNDRRLAASAYGSRHARSEPFSPGAPAAAGGPSGYDGRVPDYETTESRRQRAVEEIARGHAMYGVALRIVCDEYPAVSEFASSEMLQLSPYQLMCLTSVLENTVYPAGRPASTRPEEATIEYARAALGVAISAAESEVALRSLSVTPPPSQPTPVSTTTPPPTTQTGGPPPSAAGPSAPPVATAPTPDQAGTPPRSRSGSGTRADRTARQLKYKTARHDGATFVARTYNSGRYLAQAAVDERTAKFIVKLHDMMKGLKVPCAQVWTKPSAGPWTVRVAVPFLGSKATLSRVWSGLRRLGRFEKVSAHDQRSVTVTSHDDKTVSVARLEPREPRNGSPSDTVPSNRTAANSPVPTTAASPPPGSLAELRSTVVSLQQDIAALRALSNNNTHTDALSEEPAAAAGTSTATTATQPPADTGSGVGLTTNATPVTPALDVRVNMQELREVVAEEMAAARDREQQHPVVQPPAQPPVQYVATQYQFQPPQPAGAPPPAVVGAQSPYATPNLYNALAAVAPQLNNNAAFASAAQDFLLAARRLG